MMIVFTALIGHYIKNVMILFLKVIKVTSNLIFRKKNKETYHFFSSDSPDSFYATDIIKVNLCEFFMQINNFSSGFKVTKYYFRY